MIQFKSGRLFIQKCSFLLPDGFYLEAVEAGGPEEMVVVRTPDRSATLSVTICKQTKETWESLWEIFSENSGLKPLSKIERVIANGLLGHGIFYTGALRSGLYYAARFVLPGGRAVAFAAQYPDGDPVPENSGFVSLVLHSLCAY